MRTTPKTANTATDSRLAPPPNSSHKIMNCASCSKNAASRLAMSQLPTAGTTRRSGSTNQSVRAKMNLPMGLPERVDMGMRWCCMYRRKRQVPVSKPAATSSKSETIW